MAKPKLIILSLLIAAAAVVAICYSGDDYSWARFVFMPLATGLILVLAAIAPRPINARYHGAILAGLVFSLAGDMFLMFGTDATFVPGLICFAVTHVCYLIAFTSDTSIVHKLLPSLFLWAIGAVLLALLLPNVGPGLKLPMMVYIMLIVSTTAQAIGRAFAIGRWGALVACIGAVIFLVSDTVLAFNRFGYGFDGAQVVILGTYFTGQWLIGLSVSSRGTYVEPGEVMPTAA